MSLPILTIGVDAPSLAIPKLNPPGEPSGNGKHGHLKSTRTTSADATAPSAKRDAKGEAPVPAIPSSQATTPPATASPTEPAGFVGLNASPTTLTTYAPIGPAPQLDTTFIHAAVMADLPGADESVAEHHRDLHSVARAGERAHLEELHLHLCERAQQIAGHLRGLRSALAAIPQYLDRRFEEGCKLWSATAAFAMAGNIVGGLALLFTDAHACATTLQESGLATFAAEPWRAWAMSSAPVILSAVSKTGLRFVESRAVQTAVTLIFTLVAITAALAWAYLFAMTFPGLAQPASEILGNPFESGAVSGSNLPAFATRWLVLLQIIAGGLGSAVMFELAHRIYDGHQASNRDENPQYTTTMKNLQALETVAHQDAEQRGRIKGRIREIDSEGSVLSRAAVKRFHALRELAQRDRKRLADLLQP